MLRSLKDLERYTVTATDGDIGSVANFLIDDEHWTVRYLVVETGGFFSERRVLIAPISFRQIDWSTKQFHLKLTKEKVKSSPNVDADKPVCRQHEQEYYGYYGYPYYWGDTAVWGTSANPVAVATGTWDATPIENSEQSGDIHLRSVNEVRGYNIRGSDEAIGNVDDFIVDDETWEVRYLVVDTSNWWVGKKVLIAPNWATRVSWEERNVHVNLSRQSIMNSPEWSPTVAIDREYETRLHTHYERPSYWNDLGPLAHSPVAQQHPTAH